MTEYYSALFKPGKELSTNSWFNLKQHKNKKCKETHLVENEVNYIKTFTIILYLTQQQKSIMKAWLNDCIKLYNLTNEYLKSELDATQKLNKHYKLPTYYDLRATLKSKIQDLCKINNLNKHVADDQVKSCLTAWKSSYTLHKRNYKNFDIHNKKLSIIRKNLYIYKGAASEKNNFNSIFSSVFGEIKSNRPLNLIQKDSRLFYNKIKDEFKINVPILIKEEVEFNRAEQCGIDIGVRSFLTTYSEDSAYEIGTNTYPLMEKYFKKIDSINSNKSKNKKYKKIMNKYTTKLKNYISDMHNKSANFLLNNYSNIIIGNPKIKSMVSNLDSVLQSSTKRKLYALRHYKFRTKLISMSKKFSANVFLHSERYTTQTCSCCGSRYKPKDAKIYSCINADCGLIIDRDINAAINIYKKTELV